MKHLKQTVLLILAFIVMAIALTGCSSKLSNEKLAILYVAQDVKDNLQNPHSLKIYEASAKKEGSTYLVHFNYSGTNKVGGEVEHDGYYELLKEGNSIKFGKASSMEVIFSSDADAIFEEKKELYKQSSGKAVKMSEKEIMKNIDSADTSGLEF